MAEIHAEKEIERIRNEHSSGLAERTEALERDAAVRKARLAERIAKRREEAKSSASERSDAEQKELEARLNDEEERERNAIDCELEDEKRKLAAEVQRTQEQMKLALQEAAKRNAEEMETLLLSCKSAHAEESKRLAEALEVERQRQERALQERIAKRREMKRSAPAKSALDAAPVTDDPDDDREQRELKAQLEAKESAAWEEMRRKQEEELNGLTKQAEELALKKQDEARRMQEATQAELERLRKEHEEEMASLTTSLEAEQKRQQQQLQQRIAQRRQQKKEAEHVAADEKERLAQLEEQERAERQALEAQLKEELERKLEEERERQRREEAELSMRLEQAAIDAAAADAARKAMDAAREVELERLATEFEEKSRELRQSHMADLMAQKKKLEARVAAKKQKKLMDLEAKKELERRRLQEKQQEEQAVLQSDEQQTQAALEHAVTIAGGVDPNDATNDSSTPRWSEPTADESTPPASSVEAEIAAAKLEMMQRVEAERATSPPPEGENPDDDTESAEAEAAQQEKDISAIQELFDQRVIPRRLTLMSGVELVVSERHHKEKSNLLARLYQEKTRAMRDALRDVMKQKAIKKALLARDATLSMDAREAAVKALEEEFDRVIKETEGRTIAELEARHAARLERLQQRQIAQIQALMGMFTGLHSAIVARLQQEETEASKVRQQLSKLEQLRDETEDGEDEGMGNHRVAGRRRRERGQGEGDDTDDLINELRARLRVDANERMKQLATERDAQLVNLQRETETQLQRVDSSFRRLLEEECQAMEAAFKQRLEDLPSSAPSTQRDVLAKEKDAQVANLVLMLTARCRQQMGHVKQLAARKSKTIEEEFDRKMEVVHAKMLQRLVEEKDLIRKKRAMQGAVAHEAPQDTGDTSAGQDDDESLPRSVACVTDQSQPTNGTCDPAPSRSSVAPESVFARDLQAVLEARLSKIEELLTTRRSQDTLPSVETQRPDEAAMEAAGENKVLAFKQSVADAVAEACQWRAVLGDLPSPRSNVLDVVPSDTISAPTRVRLDFANALIGLMAMSASEGDKLTACIRRVVVASSLPTRSWSGVAHGTSFDPSSQTLYVLMDLVERLSAGQLAVLILHALVQAQTSCLDLADPTFIRQLYRVLVCSYDKLYDKAHAEAPTAAQVSPSLTADAKGSTSQRTRAPLPSRSVDSEWQAHIVELESFLSALDHPSTAPDADSKSGAVSPRGALSRQSKAVVTALGMARSSSRYLMSSSTASSFKEGAAEMEALMLHERRQFLLEKRDTAEKLYTQVLRQHQEQKESLEYIQEMLTEEQEQDEAEFTSAEDKAAHAKRVEDLRRDVEAIEAALDKTRRERDDLFAQCQALRDELAQLPPSRPSTGVSAIPAVAESK
ncbi:hypothetical protein ATCC90586_011851 [Pythium insidiosum]|nr:hypothetical protein ATCC90586_011851 [Pythium insidiosum]